MRGGRACSAANLCCQQQHATLRASTIRPVGRSQRRGGKRGRNIGVSSILARFGLGTLSRAVRERR